MRRLLPIISLLLLALWLPATQHCALEEVGLLAQTCQDNCGSSEKDGCGTVESGAYKPATTIFKVQAPNLTLCACFFCFLLTPPVLLERPELPNELIQRAQGRIAVWQFVRRTAPLPGAPSLAVA